MIDTNNIFLYDWQPYVPPHHDSFDKCKLFFTSFYQRRRPPLGTPSLSRLVRQGSLLGLQGWLGLNHIKESEEERLLRGYAEASVTRSFLHLGSGIAAFS